MTDPADAPRHDFTPGLDGWITHTHLASADPAATKGWCERMFGWTFMTTVPTVDGGEYHLFAYSERGGGGVRGLSAGETPGSVPFVHVADAQAAFDAAIEAGAESIAPPTRVMEGVTTAVVRAPGGVPIGISGP